MVKKGNINISDVLKSIQHNSQADVTIFIGSISEAAQVRPFLKWVLLLLHVSLSRDPNMVDFDILLQLWK